MVEMRSQLAIERAGLVTLHLQLARRSSIPTIWPCSGHLSEMAWSIRGDVKNIFLLPPEARVWFATSSPCHHRRRWCGVVPLGDSISAAASSVSSDDANQFRNGIKPCGCTVSTMGLSEARGLVLFRVIRGGIGVTQRLGATGTVPSTGHSHTHPRTRASQEPTDHHHKRSPEMEEALH